MIKNPLVSIELAATENLVLALCRNRNYIKAKKSCLVLNSFLRYSLQWVSSSL